MIPENDPTVLFTTAGMQQLVPYLMGKEHPLGDKLCSVQRCIRTNDIDDVGDARHLTCFEMLGNWSLGAYFKKESIQMSYEFLTKHLEIPAEKLFVTVFEGQDAVALDEDSINHWVEAGIPKTRIFPRPAGDNWWPAYGAKGPCGPDTEIYYDTGLPKCGPHCIPSCDCPKYLEIWNNVFMEFNCDGEGHFEKLKKQNVDTGMGLERIVMVLNEKNTVFETDIFRPSIEKIEMLSGKKYVPFEKKEEDLLEDEAREAKSIRIIVDHIRAACFMIGDGVAPSNEGRGYVLRRLLRRAIYNMRLLNASKVKQLVELVDLVVEKMGEFYPNLVERKNIIASTLTLETEKFLETIEKGEKQLNELIATAKRSESNTIRGADAFKLYDTFGFPVSLTLEIAKNADVTVDMDEYSREMESQKERSREGSKEMFSRGREAVQAQLEGLPKTEFLGYEEESKKVFLDGAKVIKIISLENNEVAIVTDKTIFYAESGGQVGDTGRITEPGRTKEGPEGHRVNNSGGFAIDVVDAQKYDGVWVHFCHVDEKSNLALPKLEGQMVDMHVFKSRRQRVMANHTGAHLFHLALHEILGEGADQAGSYVDDQRMRFDFNYPKAVDAEQLEKIENRVNQLIEAWLPVTKEELSMTEAKARGAVGLFTEKYGDTVRVITIGGSVSVELCGGTHVSNTAEIGIAKIIKESSVASGIRRIEMLTGSGVYNFLKDQEKHLKAAMNELKAGRPEELVEKIKTQKQAVKDLEEVTSELKMKILESRMDEFAKDVSEKDGKKFIQKVLPVETLDEVKAVATALRSKKLAEYGMLSNTAGHFVIFSDVPEISARKLFDSIREKSGAKGGGNDGMVQGTGLGEGITLS